MRTNVPSAVLQRFLATCPVPVDIGSGWQNTFSLHTAGGFSVLSRIVQSELVDRIDVSCRKF